MSLTGSLKSNSREDRGSSLLVNHTAENHEDPIMSVLGSGERSSKESRHSFITQRNSVSQYDPSASKTAFNLARARRRSTISERHDRATSLRVLLPEPARRKGPLLLLPYPSEVFPTKYNRRLPEWRWRAGYSAYNDHWRNETEYVLVAFACTVGLTNIVYFPMLALKYHHGSFLYAYVIVMFLIGFPFLFLHLALGQFTAKDAAWVYTLFPLARGVGISIMLYSLLNAMILTLELSWFAYFTFASLNIRFAPNFSWQVPWKSCEIKAEKWQHNYDCNHFPDVLFNISSFYCAAVYFHDKVGALSGNCTMINGFGEHVGNSINWPFVGCACFVVTCAFFITFRHIKTIGTVVLVILPIHIFLMLIFMFSDILFSHDPEIKQASVKGMLNFFTPKDKIHKDLQDFELWFAVTSHVVKSLSLDSGAMIYIGSHARFQSSAHYHAFFIATADICLSILSGVIIFSILGVLDHFTPGAKGAIQLGVISHSRAFLLYVSTAVDRMDNFAAPFMFVMLSSVIFLGLIRVICNMAVFLGPLEKLFPRFKQDKLRLLGKGIASLLITILLIPFQVKGTPSRFALLTMFMQPPTENVPLVLGIITASTFIYGYGLTRLRQDIDFMLHYYPNRAFCIIWYCTPIVCVLITILQLIDPILYPVKYKNRREPSGIYNAVLWFIFAVIFIPIFVVALWTVYVYYRKGVLRKIRRPLETFAPRLHEMSTKQREPKESENDSKLQRQEAITTLSSIKDGIDWDGKRRRTIEAAQTVMMGSLPSEEQG